MGYLGNRIEPLTSTLGDGSARPAPRSSGSRRVYLGTVPDFTDSLAGVLFEDVVTGSPAEAAGLRAGDRLLLLNDQKVEDLRGYSELLKELKPGETVRLQIVRGTETLEFEVVLGER